MNPHPNEVLATAVADLMLQLHACEEQSRFRKAALECILYATTMPECPMCMNSLDNGKVIVLLRTTCNHLFCRGCWRQYREGQRDRLRDGLPQSLCPYRTCPKLDDNGEIERDAKQKPIIGPCSISCVTSNDKLLYRIALTREKLQNRFEAAIFPNVFSEVKPYLLREMDFPNKDVED